MVVCGGNGGDFFMHTRDTAVVITGDGRETEGQVMAVFERLMVVCVVLGERTWQ